MPTPRPEMSETSEAVEKPGAKIRLSICSSVTCWSGPTTPRSRAISSTRSRLIPAPSSSTTIRILPPACSAESLIVPVSGLPLARRFSGLSMP